MLLVDDRAAPQSGLETPQVYGVLRSVSACHMSHVSQWPVARPGQAGTGLVLRTEYCVRYSVAARTNCRSPDPFFILRLHPSGLPLAAGHLPHKCQHAVELRSDIVKSVSHPFTTLYICCLLIAHSGHFYRVSSPHRRADVSSSNSES
jgi:hypothetical protein